MATLEEERLVQMVLDFMEPEEPAPPICPSSSQLTLSLHHHKCLMLKGIVRSLSGAETEVYQRALKHVGEIGGEKNKNSSANKRLMMRLRMDGFHASLCRSSWLSSLECPGGGDYEFIDIVVIEESGAYTRLILDMDFKSQFELARPTSAYTQMTDILPPIFVGNEEKLKKVVSLLCSAAQQSLRAKGLHVPPWRTTNYMQSKWLSSCHSKVPTIPLPNTFKLKLEMEKGRRRGHIVSTKGWDLGNGSQEAPGSDIGICC